MSTITSKRRARNVAMETAGGPAPSRPYATALLCRKESGKPGLIPSMAQLLQAGRASYRRIKDQERGVRRLRKLNLSSGWIRPNACG